MMLIFGLSEAMVNIFVSFWLLLYMPALFFLLIGYRFMLDSFAVLVRRNDLPSADRVKQAKHMAFEGLLGLTAGVAVFASIFCRKEIYQCVTGLL
jgi:hypothetical protein